jgi:hypothetical protein
MSGNGLKRLLRLAAAAVLMAGPARAWADPLPVGGDVTPSVVNTTGVSAGATILADTGWMSGMGEVREIVVKGDTNNPNGGLDFIYQVQNTTSSPGLKLSALDAFHFGNYLTDVLAANPGGHSFTNGSNSFGTPGPRGNDPTGSERTDNGGGVGNQVSFLFGPPGLGALTPGSYSDLLIVRTNAPAYAPGVIDFHVGGTSGHLSGYQPAGPSNVPEPSTLVLLGGYLAVLGVFSAWLPRRKLDLHDQSLVTSD